MTNEEFIAQNKNADVHALALGKVPTGINLHYCLRQIEGWQKAQQKLPSWAKTEGIIYPVRLSIEQCSSEQTALYKQKLVARLLPENRQRMVDLTGGFGIDFSCLAQLFDEADYVEQNKQLCETAHHNFPLLGLSKARVHNKTCEEYIDGMGLFSLIYLDPSRRDAAGRKMVALSDCTPDIEILQDKLLDHATMTIVKLSPMLDIQDTLRRLPNVNEVHVVSVNGECKEMLLVLCREKRNVIFHCTNIAAQTQTFSTEKRETEPLIASRLERYLYEPNASILKAGVQNALCQTYNVGKLHPFSHLFTSPHFIKDFPGRAFVIEDYCGFAKKDIKVMLAGIIQCNLTIRNFPSTVTELRKRLKLREGGDDYLFATTLGDGSHALLRCRFPH
jgi:16S rRNA G966 N2-methylase RsmD